jgi:hypothetical protein
MKTLTVLMFGLLASSVSCAIESTHATDLVVFLRSL